MAKTDKNRYVRFMVVAALEKIGGPKALATLWYVAGHDGEYRVRQAAWQAHARLKKRPPKPGP